jgi:hypothetical protein
MPFGRSTDYRRCARPHCLNRQSSARSRPTIRNEQTDLRFASDFRDYQSAEEVLAKIRDEFGPDAAAALRRFSRAIERQGPDSRFDRNNGHVIDIGPDRVDD